MPVEIILVVGRAKKLGLPTDEFRKCFAGKLFAMIGKHGQILIVAVQCFTGRWILRTVDSLEHHRVVYIGPIIHRASHEPTHFIAVILAVGIVEDSDLIRVAYAGDAAVVPECCAAR